MALSKSTPLEIIPGLVFQGRLSTDQDVIITGSYAGELATQGELIVLGTGKMTGKLEAQALTIDMGGEVEAEMVIGRKPAGKKAGPDGNA